MADAPATGERSSIVDFGGHLYTDRVSFRPELFDAYEDVVPFFSDVDELVDRYRAAGITGAVLVAPQYAQFGVDRAAAANDVLLDVVGEHDLFVGALASIPMVEDGGAAAGEFERCLDAGFNGGVVETRSESGLTLTDDPIAPVLEVADRTGAPIMVHPKKMDVLSDTYRNDSIFGHEMTLSDSLCTVIHDGVLDRYPNLNLVYDHFGGNVASMLGRLEYQLRPERWPGDSPMKPWPEFRAQLERRIYLKMSGFYGHDAPLRATLEAFPSSQLLFGTDFPFEARTPEELERFVEGVERAASGVDCRRIFAGNATDLLVNLD